MKDKRPIITEMQCRAGVGKTQSIPLELSTMAESIRPQAFYTLLEELPLLASAAFAGNNAILTRDSILSHDGLMPFEARPSTIDKLLKQRLGIEKVTYKKEPHVSPEELISHLRAGSLPRGLLERHPLYAVIEALRGKRPILSPPITGILLDESQDQIIRHAGYLVAEALHGGVERIILLGDQRQILRYDAVFLSNTKTDWPGTLVLPDLLEALGYERDAVLLDFAKVRYESLRLTERYVLSYVESGYTLSIQGRGVALEIDSRNGLLPSQNFRGIRNDDGEGHGFFMLSESGMSKVPSELNAIILAHNHLKKAKPQRHSQYSWGSERIEIEKDLQKLQDETGITILSTFHDQAVRAMESFIKVPDPFFEKGSLELRLGEEIDEEIEDFYSDEEIWKIQEDRRCDSPETMEGRYLKKLFDDKRPPGLWVPEALEFYMMVIRKIEGGSGDDLFQINMERLISAIRQLSAVERRDVFLKMGIRRLTDLLEWLSMKRPHRASVILFEALTSERFAMAYTIEKAKGQTFPRALVIERALKDRVLWDAGKVPAGERAKILQFLFENIFYVAFTRSNRTYLLRS